MESPKQALSLTTASSCHIQGFSDILAASHGLNPIKNDSHSCSAIPCPISLYEGSQPLVNRRSTISVHRTMGLGNHDTGIIRCKSAPGIFLAGIAFKQPVAAIPGECDSVCLQELQYSQVTDVVTGHRSDNQSSSYPTTTTNRVQQKHNSPIATTNIVSENSSIKGYRITPAVSLHSETNRDVYKSHDTLISTRYPQIDNHEDESIKETLACLSDVYICEKSLQLINICTDDANKSVNLVIENAAGNIGGTDGSGHSSLTVVEPEAIGGLVPMCQGELSNEKSMPKQPFEDALPNVGTSGVTIKRPWRAHARRLFKRRKPFNGQQRGFSHLSIRPFNRKAHIRQAIKTTKRQVVVASKISGGVDPQTARLKKSPSLFLRIWNGSVRRENPADDGEYSNIPSTPGIVDWIKTGVFTKRQAASQVNRYNPELIKELNRYFGSDVAIKQLLLAVSKTDSTIMVHHPINPFILHTRHIKHERETIFQGNQLRTYGQSPYFSGLKRRFGDENRVRIINRHGENWKLLKFSKTVNQDIGTGELTLEDFNQPERQVQVQGSSGNIVAGVHIIPPRKSSQPPPNATFSTKTSTRRASISTIGWAESIKEYEGNVGKVHPSGERSLCMDQPHLEIYPVFLENKSQCDAENSPYLMDMTNKNTNSPNDSGKSTTTKGKASKTVQKNVVVSGQWPEALQLMQEYEDEAEKLRRKCNRKASWNSCWRTFSTSRESTTNIKNDDNNSNLRQQQELELDQEQVQISLTERGGGGFIDYELREACRVAIMNASVLQQQQRTLRSSGSEMFY